MVRPRNLKFTGDFITLNPKVRQIRTIEKVSGFPAPVSPVRPDLDSHFVSATN